MKNSLNRFLKKKNEAPFSIYTIIITLIVNMIFMKSHIALIKLFLLYIPSIFIGISFFYIIKHKLYSQEVSHEANAYSYIEDLAMPKLDRVIIFFSTTVCVWMVLTTGLFFKLFLR
jgi:hypothetical protein